jgi:hypothetical protein
VPCRRYTALDAVRECLEGLFLVEGLSLVKLGTVSVKLGTVSRRSVDGALSEMAEMGGGEYTRDSS